MSRRLTLNRAIFDLPPMRVLGMFVHAWQSGRQMRTQSTATKLFRNVRQFQALEGPLAHLAAADRLRVLVAACSTGCEAYTLAGYLAARFPQLDWRIDAFDLSPDAVCVARRGQYAHLDDAAYDETDLVGRISRRLLERHHEGWVVAQRIRDRMSFEVADVLAPSMARRCDYDLVLGQNFMIHMLPEAAARALSALVGAARPGGALFLGGMDPTARVAALTAHRLRPVTWQLEAIHDADAMRRSAWPWYYWALEPINPHHPEHALRYSTIFTKP